ncbi:MAG: hypothetical protein JO363_01380 [Solirubrobacterales bacterium]|nr:hypothetical protein [Solirubrobacterales bacterium]
MTNSSGRDRVPADLEIAGGLRAARARWEQTARTTTIASGGVDAEELRQREPDDPDRGRTYRDVRRVWQFRARLTDVVRHHRS